jgi:hypothetical protein
MHELNIPIVIASDTTFNVSSGSSLLIANPITVNQGLSVTQVGGGTVTYQSIITLQSGASLSLASPTNANTLAVAAAAMATVAAHSTGAVNMLQLDTLALTDGGTVDLSNNAAILHYADLGTITGEVRTGYASGTWTGTGITSSAAAADTSHLTALGVIQNNQGGTPIYSATNLFDGQAPQPTDVLIKYTYYGDANLDGQVEGSDFTLIDNGFNNSLTGWFNGDFNYDGVVDGSDYTLIDNAFNTQGASLAGEIAASTAQIAASAAVPEPGALSVFAIGAIALLGRRTRRVRLNPGT